MLHTSAFTCQKPYPTDATAVVCFQFPFSIPEMVQCNEIPPARYRFLISSNLFSMLREREYDLCHSPHASAVAPDDDNSSFCVIVAASDSVKVCLSCYIGFYV
ncbi:hypothetical protein AVEN_214871-1 [Araneus ventricosus]|uniref:Uncharacterized protein n=1 Tax=Araneus ventricosus TaxID=182803 RepID=A0A4Y2L6B1_ARAVE|nr:hypothetical protein AVEN_214871-1 [Araneus ventricosus]